MTLQEKDLKSAGAKMKEIQVLYRCKILNQTSTKVSQKVHWQIGYHIACVVMERVCIKFQTKLKFFS